jgi:MFS family permease
MRIGANFSSLKQTSFREHLVRFVLGGAVTVGAGLIAREWGPVIGGLFLAFPAIFPAGATLIETHEVKRKREIGRDGRRRGRLAAAIDALGASFGAVGLAAFAVVLWRFLPGHSSWGALMLALASWAVVSGALWILRKLSKRVRGEAHHSMERQKH